MKAAKIRSIIEVRLAEAKVENVIVAIGDIHGCDAAVGSLMELIEPTGARVVFLGDYVDRGPDSPAVIERMIRYSFAHPSWKFLAGNHEQMLLMMMPEDMAVGLRRPDDAAYQYDTMGGLPASHRSFINGLPFWYESERFLFVHGGVGEGDKEISEVDPTQIIWSYDIPPMWSGKTIVRGHLHVKNAEVNANHINLDTGCCFGGWLTAGILNDKTGEAIGFLQVSPDGMVVKFCGLEGETIAA